MPKLFEKTSGRPLGEISQQDLDLLIAQFEEESSRDRDYYVNRDTFELLSQAGASSGLLGALESALADSGEADIRWEAD